ELRMVTPRPGLIRLALLAPRQCDLQIGIAPKTSLALSFKHRSLRQALIDPGGTRFFVNPFLQPAPGPNQTLMRDVNQRFRTQWSRRSHPERSTRTTNRLNYINHLRLIRLGKRAKHSQRYRPPDFAIVRSFFRQGFEEFLCHALTTSPGQ